MSFLQENESISDELIDQMLLTLKEKEDTQEKPPVINTFRLEMKRERRRSRIQLEIVTIAAFVSVTSTVVFTSVFFRRAARSWHRSFSSGRFPVSRTSCSASRK